MAIVDPDVLWLGRLPKDESHFHAWHVDPDVQWKLFWGIDHEGHRLLVFEHERESDAPSPLPRGRNIAFERRFGPDGYLLVIRLLDQELSDLFHQLCLDVIPTCSDAATEREAMARLVNRFRAWGRFFSEVPPAPNIGEGFVILQGR